MTEANSKWDRGNLAEWLASHSEARKAADAKLLAGIFNLAASVPQLKEALDWAKAHDIEFIVDRTVKANGYYRARTGIVALSANVLKDPATAVGTVTHEIRHAWQDWYGMLSHPVERFANYFYRIVLIEADAEAFGARARQQYALRRQQAEYSQGLFKLFPRKKRIDKIEKQIEAIQKSPDFLWQAFLGWFHRGRAAVYGTEAVKNLASALGVPGVKKQDLNPEFKPFGGRELPERPVVDFMQDDQLRRLGKGFSGQNYFNGAARREDLRSIFRPAMAERFYNRKNTPPKLMVEIRKRVLRQQLEKTGAPVLKLPS